MMPATGCIAAALLGLGILIGRVSHEFPPNRGAIAVTLIPPAPKPTPAPVHLAPKLAPVIRPRPKPRARPPRQVRRPPVEKPPPVAAAPAPPSPAPGKSSSVAAVAPPLSGAPGGTGSALFGSAASSSGARAIYAPLPKIPEDMRENPFRTVAIARFEVSAEGNTTVKLVSPTPYPRLNEILMQTLKNWRFFPAVVHGKPVASTFDIRIPFVVD